jgi:PAS domain S-box-containing protein
MWWMLAWISSTAVSSSLNLFKRYRADIERSTDVTVYVEVEQYRKDGSAVWVETAIRTVYDKDRKLTGFRGVSRDISKRK